jgi:hypothetical protein
MPDDRTLYERVRNARFVLSPTATQETSPMAQRSPTIAFEDVPLDEARRMGQGPRMDPELYAALKQKIQSMDNTAARLVLPEGTKPTTMKNRILRVAAELNIPMTIRKIPRGLRICCKTLWEVS